MSEHRVTSRYAKSLITLAQEKGVLEEVNEDMSSFARICQENRDFTLMLKNPVIRNYKKSQILARLFEDKVHPITKVFFDIITRKNREMLLPGIAAEFHQQYNIIHNIGMAKVTTVFPLDESLREEFRKLVIQFTGVHDVELEEKTDVDLVGGFVLKLDDQQMDESLSGKLKELELEFS